MINERHDSRLLMLALSVIFALPYSVVAVSIVNAPFVSIFLVSIMIFYCTLGNLKIIKNQNLRSIYVILSLIKLGLLILVASTKPPFLAGVDWINFHNYALTAIADGGSLIHVYNNSLDLFVFMIAFIYYIFGPFVDQIYFYVFALSLLVFRYMYKVVHLVTSDEKIATLAALVVMAWPVSLIFSVSLLREIPTQLAVIVSFYNFVKYLKFKKRKNAVGAFGFALAAALIHSGMVVIAFVYIYILIQGNLAKKRKLFSLGAVAVTLVFVFLALQVPALHGITDRFTEISSIDDVNKQFEFQLVASTTYITSAPESFMELIYSVPYRFFMFTFSPLPWQIKSFETFVTFLIDGLLQVGLIIILLRVLKRSKGYDVFTRNVIVAAVLCLAATYLVFSLGTNNYGTAMRHRAKVLPIAIVVASIYYAKPPRKLKKPPLKIDERN